MQRGGGSALGTRISRGAGIGIFPLLHSRWIGLRLSQQKYWARYRTSQSSLRSCYVLTLSLWRSLSAFTPRALLQCPTATSSTSLHCSQTSLCPCRGSPGFIRGRHTPPVVHPQHHLCSSFSVSLLYASSACYCSSSKVFDPTRTSLGSGVLRRALETAKALDGGEEVDMAASVDNGGASRRTRKPSAALKSPTTTGKRKYTRRGTAAASKAVMDSVDSATEDASGSSTSVSGIRVNDGASTHQGGDSASDTDPPDPQEGEVGEVYNGQCELSSEETYRRTSERLLLPLNAVRFVLMQAKEGATIPFLARYRQGETGRMDETQLRLVMDTAKEVTEVHRRRQFMLRSLESRGLLTPALQTALESMVHISQLEDAWEPYKERRTSLASRGRAAGLGPYADALLNFNPEDPECRALLDELKTFVRRTDDGERLLTAIVAENVQRSEELRHRLGEYCRHTARLSSALMAKPRKKAAKELHEENFEALRKHFAYYDSKSWPVQRVAAHVVLALQRGEAKGALKVDMVSGPKSHGLFMHTVREQYPSLNRLLSSSSSSVPTSDDAGACSHVFRDVGYGRKIVQASLQAAYDYLVKQAHFAIRRDLKKSAEQEAIVVFAHNLQHMLLQRPLSRARILAMDPGLANGVKCVALDENGAVETFFTCTLMDEQKMRRYVIQVVESRKMNKVVIGNGTASDRVTDLIADLIKQQKWTDVEFAVVSEAGASVYSVSDIAKEEFPNLDVMYRGAVSIGRRVLDPLSELVKIPVRSMGIGMYQHDVNEKELMQELNYVLESCVAKVGVNAASANRYVMEKVPGIKKRIVDQIVLARHAKKLHSREDLRRVPAMTESVYEQIAGFFRFPNSPEPLDNTNIHPESYPLVRRLVMLYTSGQLGDGEVVAETLGDGADGAAMALANARIRQQVAQQLERMSPAQLANLASGKLSCRVETLELLRQELLHPGLDPRASLPHAGLLRREVYDVKNLRPGELLSGVVQSVTMFGAFVDCGLHDSVLLRGEGVDALQVGMYLDKCIRFDSLDHLKRPRVFLVRTAAHATSGDSADGGKGCTLSAAPRRLRLESEDVLGSNGRGLVSPASPDVRLYNSLANNVEEDATAAASTLTARVMRERKRRSEEALSSANGIPVTGARRAEESSHTKLTSHQQIPHTSVGKRAREKPEVVVPPRQMPRCVEDAVVASSASHPHATPSVQSLRCSTTNGTSTKSPGSVSQVSKPAAWRVDTGNASDQHDASRDSGDAVFLF
ncbi:transcription modulator/accessory protein, putative [Leishmania tarentolae]|uniref:Transcription modulator/accessory protein, putative n=1 Tax=Leishmania tarentolae TaxID=5689 RepID=A0A640KFZ8_LEITA|nr:transcription modulator/accessory protein, putative [Leishmania tarentolae]